MGDESDDLHPLFCNGLPSDWMTNPELKAIAQADLEKGSDDDTNAGKLTQQSDIPPPLPPVLKGSSRYLAMRRDLENTRRKTVTSFSPAGSNRQKGSERRKADKLAAEGEMDDDIADPFGKYGISEVANDKDVAELNVFLTLWRSTKRNDMSDKTSGEENSPS